MRIEVLPFSLKLVHIAVNTVLVSLTHYSAAEEPLLHYRFIYIKIQCLVKVLIPFT